MNNNELLNRLLGISKLHVVKSEFIGEEKLHLEVASTLPVAQIVEVLATRYTMRVKPR